MVHIGPFFNNFLPALPYSRPLPVVTLGCLHFIFTWLIPRQIYSIIERKAGVLSLYWLFFGERLA